VKPVCQVCQEAGAEEGLTMKQIFVAVLAANGAVLAAVSPVVSTCAYSRSTIPGIPEGPRAEGPSRNALPDTYFIYVVVRKGTALSARRVWVKGRCHAATLQRVASPVRIEHDAAVPTGKTDTLVPKTRNDVYRVVPGEEEGCGDEGRPFEELKNANAVVVALKIGRTVFYGTARTVTPLHPAAAM
jgi:hypothetical protein